MRNKIAQTSAATARRNGPATMMLMVLVAVLGLVMSCGGAAGGSATGGSATGGAPTAPNTVVIKNFTFMPASVTVAPGTKVTVINEDQATHTFTARDKSFDSGHISGGQRAEVTAPSKPGTYPYICDIHQYMMGTLIVQ
ncbi:MAG: cupredoxin domain-containing protein [Pseudonocardiaceae bacterium]